MGQALRNNTGYHRIYICGHKAYDNELAMYRHEGVDCNDICYVETVFDANPKIAYRVNQGGTIYWATDLVDVIHLRKQVPDACVEIIPIQR